MKRISFYYVPKLVISDDHLKSLCAHSNNIDLLQLLTVNYTSDNIPSCLSKFKDLTYLQIQLPNFNGTFPNFIYNLTNLQVLYLGFGTIKGKISLESLCHLSALEELILFKQMSMLMW